MNLPMTLSRYLAKSYLVNFLFITGLLLSIIYLFDTVELLRRANKRDDIPFGLVLEMGWLKLPEVGQLILPFAVLFSAMFTFWQLTRRHELTIVRSSGFSVWQFLTPVVTIALTIGVLYITVINPIGAAFLGKFERLENEHLSHRKNYVTLLREGLWLKQDRPQQGHVILHSDQIKLPDWTLNNVIVLFFDENDNFERRIDSPSAYLDQKKGQWVFKNVIDNTPPGKSEKLPLVVLPTDLTIQELEESFASPETVSFWQLPGFIKTLEATGFDSTKLKIHFQSLLSQPLMFVAMILLAASVSLRPPRQRGTLILIVIGLTFGFIIFFMTSFMQALGVSQQIPAFLAAWSPSIVTILLGVAVMLNLEDG